MLQHSYFANEEGLWLRTYRWLPEGTPKGIVILVR